MLKNIEEIFNIKQINANDVLFKDNSHCYIYKIRNVENEMLLKFLKMTTKEATIYFFKENYIFDTYIEKLLDNNLNERHLGFLLQYISYLNKTNIQGLEIFLLVKQDNGSVNSIDEYIYKLRIDIQKTDTKTTHDFFVKLLCN